MRLAGIWRQHSRWPATQPRRYVVTTTVAIEVMFAAYLSPASVGTPLIVRPWTSFADPGAVMPSLLVVVGAICSVAIVINLLAHRLLVNGGLLSLVTLGALFVAAFLHHLVDPAPWFGESGPGSEPTSHFLSRYLRTFGVPIVASGFLWWWFRRTKDSGRASRAAESDPSQNAHHPNVNE